MWICSKDGFFSIVQIPAREAWAVRARDRRHLAAALPGHPVIETPKADYPFRACIGRGELDNLMLRFSDGCDYPNFKSRVDKNGGWYSRALHEVWEVFWSRSFQLRPHAQAGE